MRFLKILKRLALYVLPVVVLVAVALLLKRMRAHQIETDSDFARDHGAPLPVRVYRVENAPLQHSVPVECTAQPNPLVQVRGRLPTRPIIKTQVHIGDWVKRGALLVSLDDRPERQSIARAGELIASYEKVVGANQALLDYYRGVRDQGVGLERDLRIAAVQLAQAQTELARSQGDLRSSQADLESTQIIAPVDGVVMAVAQPGETAQPDDPLATVASIDPILLECLLPEEKLVFIEPGMPVQATFYGRPGEAYAGSLKDVDALSKEKDRIIVLRAEIANPVRAVLPGLHGVAEIRSDQRTLRIPSVALINPRTDLAQVFVIDESGKAHLRKINIGGSGAGYVQVKLGLSAGDRVVIAGQLGLHEGDSVKVSADPEAGGGT